MVPRKFSLPVWNIKLLLNIVLTWGVCTGLQCWKCIGKSCDQDPAGNYRATQMTCRDGESCMKVYYRMTENGSHILESTTRTCSPGRCVASSNQDFQKCLQTKRRYNVLGCSLRTCCQDSDLCNDASVTTGSASICAIVTSGISLVMLWTYREQ